MKRASVNHKTAEFFEVYIYRNRKISIGLTVEKQADREHQDTDR